MTCIAELDDYSDFYFFLNDSFVIFPSVWVVPGRVSMKGLQQSSIPVSRPTCRNGTQKAPKIERE